MSLIINTTIDEIKKKYKFEYNPNGDNDFKEANDIHNSLMGRLTLSFDDYHFYSRLRKLSELLKKKETKMKSKEFELYENKINELKVQVKNFDNLFLDEDLKYINLFFEFKENYDNNKDLPETLKICRNIYKELLNQLYEFSIINEKKFLLINDQIIDIEHNLNFIV